MTRASSLLSSTASTNAAATRTESRSDEFDAEAPAETAYEPTVSADAQVIENSAAFHFPSVPTEPRVSTSHAAAQAITESQRVNVPNVPASREPASKSYAGTQDGVCQQTTEAQNTDFSDSPDPSGKPTGPHIGTQEAHRMARSTENTQVSSNSGEGADSSLRFAKSRVDLMHLKDYQYGAAFIRIQGGRHIPVSEFAKKCEEFMDVRQALDPESVAILDDCFSELTGALAREARNPKSDVSLHLTGADAIRAWETMQNLHTFIKYITIRPSEVIEQASIAGIIASELRAVFAPRFVIKNVKELYDTKATKKKGDIKDPREKYEKIVEEDLYYI